MRSWHSEDFAISGSGVHMASWDDSFLIMHFSVVYLHDDNINPK